MKKVLLAAAFVLTGALSASADVNQIKVYKEAFPEAKPKCINCHADALPKKDEGKHETNAYGKAVEEAAKRRGREELAVEADFRVVGSFFYQENYDDFSENEYCYILIGKTESPIYPNEKEIAETKFLNIFELEKFCLDNAQKLTPWFIKAREYLNLEKALWSKS